MFALVDPTLERRPVVVLSNNDGCVIARLVEDLVNWKGPRSFAGCQPGYFASNRDLYTASATLGGKITAGSIIPAGSVLITLNGITLAAPIDSSGKFTAVFSTASLRVKTYTVTYACSGAGFNHATASSTLDVV